MKKILRQAVALLKAVIAGCLPMALYRQLLPRAFAGKNIALCLHRVTDDRRSTDPYPDNTFIEHDLVALLDMLYAVLPDKRLTITFDDGYEDATQFIHQYAERYPDANFLVFVCPEKVIQQAGFRWDLYEVVGGDFYSVLTAKQDIAAENQRRDLKDVCADPRFRMTSAEGLTALTRHSNVRLGNHSNCHFDFARLGDGEWQEEVARSFEDYDSLFGRTQDFAFPFGTPGRQFTPEQARFIKEKYGVNVWSTGKGGNPAAGDPTYLNRFALPGHHPLKLLLLSMIRNA